MAATASDEKGDFRVAGLPPGLYRLTASLAGFETVTIERLAVAAGARVVVDIDLPLAGISERVDVVQRASEVTAQPMRFRASCWRRPRCRATPSRRCCR